MTPTPYRLSHAELELDFRFGTKEESRLLHAEEREHIVDLTTRLAR